VLEARRRVLGPEHTATIDTMNSLAYVLRHQGDHQAARPLIDRVLEARRRVLGPEHPHTLDALENAAHWLREDERLVEARDVYERVLEVRRRVLGPDHPDTIGLPAAIADTLAGQAQWRQAAARLEEVLAAQPDNLWARFALAVVRLRLDDLGSYRRHCAWLLRQAIAGESRDAGKWAAQAAALIPDAVDDPTQSLALARRDCESHSDSIWFLPTLGAAEYRAGHASVAVARLEEARDRVVFDPLRAQIDLFLTMAYRRLGRRDDSSRVLAEARQLIAAHERFADSRGGQPGFLWLEWTRCETLLREAEATVGAVAIPTAATTSSRAREPRGDSPGP
jgi:tetratricopeptide (TPR) repeat protein